MRGDVDDIRGSLVDGGLHTSHGVLMRVQGSLIGCTQCWRYVGFACGDVAPAGMNECRPNVDIMALARYYWERIRTSGLDSPDVERMVMEFRVALRGQSAMEGGRHASGS